MMTVEKTFSDFASSLELTEEERDLVSERHIELRASLNDKLDNKDDFLTGSYPRHTLIRPKDPKEPFDVDMFIVFGEEDYDEKELEELVNILYEALQEIEKEEPLIENLREQKRSIGVVYKDNFQIDVVPSVQVGKNLYKIFDKATNEPVNSNPKIHGQILTDANEATEYKNKPRLVPIIKVLKSWKRDCCDYIKSFHLEILAVRILGDSPIESFSEGIADFFSKASDYLEEPCLTDPANEENYIDEYLDEDSTRDKLLRRIDREKEIAKGALDLEESGKEEEAIKEWRRIFLLPEAEKSKSSGEGFMPSKPWCNG